MAGSDQWPRLVVSFREALPEMEAGDVPTVLSDLNGVYEVSVLATVGGYETAYVPSQSRPRRTSRLASDDRLRVQRLTYGSPLEMVLTLDPEVLRGAMSGGLVVASGAVATVQWLPKLLNAWTETFFAGSTYRDRREMVHEQLVALRESTRRENEAHELSIRQAAAQVRRTETETARIEFELRRDELLLEREVKAQEYQQRSYGGYGVAAAARPHQPQSIEDRASAATLAIEDALERMTRLAGPPSAGLQE